MASSPIFSKPSFVAFELEEVSALNPRIPAIQNAAALAVGQIRHRVVGLAALDAFAVQNVFHTVPPVFCAASTYFTRY